MSVPVYLSVTFRADENEPLAEIARDYAPRFGDDYQSMTDGNREARYFLDDLTKRTGTNPGSSGGICAWGSIGEYTPPEIFVDALRPFFLRVWLGGVMPLDERVLIVAQRKGGETLCFGIGLDAAVLDQKRAPNLADVVVLTDILARGWCPR